MQHKGESSLLKSLAVAFGDGLAFGVGMKLTQAAVSNRKPANRIERPAAPAAAPNLDRKAVDAVVQALELRLQEQAGHLERRLADLEANIAVDLKTLNQQDEHLAKRAEEHIDALRTEIVAMQREFAEAVGRLVGEHVQTQVAEQAARIDVEIDALHGEVSGVKGEVSLAVERVFAEQATHVEEGLEKLRTEVSIAQSESAAGVNRRLEQHSAHVDAQLQAVRAETNAIKDDVLMSIGRVLGEQVQSAVNTAMHEVVEQQVAPILNFAASMSKACAELAAQIVPKPVVVSPPQRPEPPAAAPAEQSIEAVPEVEEDPFPQFGQLKRSSELWRIPLVSSFVFTAGALAFAHFL